MKQVILTMGLLLILITAKAQNATLDLMAGHSYVHYQHSFSNNFNRQSKFGWMHLAALIKRFEGTEKNPVLKDEVMNQVYLTARLNKAFKLKGGLFYTNTGGYKPSLSIESLARKENWLILISPRVDVVKNGAFEIFMASELKPPINEKLRFYARLQAMTSVSLQQHNRSYQLLRLGVETRSMQYGLGLTVDEHGKNKLTSYNTGIFVRKNFQSAN